jgi:two-component system sensor histidine kinase QseC
VAERSPRRSIRRELLVILLASVAAVWIATAVVSYFDAQHEVDELLDAHLAQSASLLLALGGHEVEEMETEHAPQLHRYNRRVAFQFWENGSVLRLHSPNAPNARFSSRDEGFSNVEIERVRWRVFSTWDGDHRFLVQVGEQHESRASIGAAIAENMLLPLAFALPALGVLVWLGIHRALRPLRSLSEQLSERAPDNLAPLAGPEIPLEVAPLVADLNRLFERVSASIDNERRFTADAAHELRTPLAALRAQAQVARGSADDAERRRALDHVIAGCDRATHLVEQLLTLARLEPESLRARREPCDLRAVAQAAIAEIAPGALAKSIDIELDSGSAVEILGDAPLLEILLRNLVDNAVRYSPAGTLVRVRVGREACAALVRVIDQGPGIAPANRADLGRRFHRLAGTEGAGTGLGLSIVERIAQLHGARVAFDEPAGGKGLQVTVSFPAS